MRMGAQWFALAMLGAWASACGGEDESGVGALAGAQGQSCDALTLVPCDCPGGLVGSRPCAVAAGEPQCTCPMPESGPPMMIDAPTAGVAGLDMSAAAAGSGAQPVWPISGGRRPGDTPPMAGGMAPATSNPIPPMEESAPMDLGATPMAGTMDDGTGSGGASTADAVPVGEHCANVSTWDSGWTQFEEEVLMLSNEARAQGHNCDTEGVFDPTGPLTMNAALRCSARLHALDMGENDYFDHASQDGTSPFDRMAAAGYVGRAAGENIAMGQQTPRQVVDGWLDSDGHCSNLMNPIFTELGVGFWEADSGGGFARIPRKYWVQNFGGGGGGRGFGRP